MKYTQMHLYELARRRIAERDNTFMELITHKTNPLTREDLEACIARNPRLWSRYAGFINKLPSRKD